MSCKYGFLPYGNGGGVRKLRICPQLLGFFVTPSHSSPFSVSVDGGPEVEGEVHRVQQPDFLPRREVQARGGPLQVNIGCTLGRAKNKSIF